MSEAVFLFGTLRHEPLLCAVLNETAHLQTSDAILSGYQTNAVLGHAFPMIQEVAGTQTQGLLVQGLRTQDIERLNYYESAFKYALRTVTLADGKTASVYLPEEGRWQADGPWSFEQWIDRWGEVSVVAAREVMAWMGRKEPSDVGTYFPSIRARAASSVRAAKSKPCVLTFEGEVDIRERRRAYLRYFALDEFDLSHTRFDGSQSDVMDREVFRPPDAALLLPYDPIRDRVLLVEQVRMGPLARGDSRLWKLEPVAGHIDPGETPETAARREALEEANVTVGQLELVAECYPSPGNSAEFNYLFAATADLPDDVCGTGGLDTEHEDIRSHLLTFDELMHMAETQQLSTAPVLVLCYWLARHRERLRRAAGVATDA